MDRLVATCVVALATVSTIANAGPAAPALDALDAVVVFERGDVDAFAAMFIEAPIEMRESGSVRKHISKAEFVASLAGCAVSGVQRLDRAPRMERAAWTCFGQSYRNSPCDVVAFEVSIVPAQTTDGRSRLRIADLYRRGLWDRKACPDRMPVAPAPAPSSRR